MRIARRDYVPSNEDVVRARLRTLGVQEHHIHFDTGAYQSFMTSRTVALTVDAIRSCRRYGLVRHIFRPSSVFLI